MSEGSLGSNNDALAGGLKLLANFFGLEPQATRLHHLNAIRLSVFKLGPEEIARRAVGAPTLRVKYSHTRATIAVPEPFHAAIEVAKRLFPQDEAREVVASLCSAVRVMYSRDGPSDKFWNVVALALARSHPDGRLEDAPASGTVDQRVRRVLKDAMDAVMEQGLED